MARVGDVDLFFEVRGAGAPVVLIPGLGSDVRMFKGTSDGLAERFRVLAFDPRGAGRSGKPDVPYSIEMMADDAVGLMSEAGMSKAVVVAVSMGGRIALADSTPNLGTHTCVSVRPHVRMTAPTGSARSTTQFSSCSAAGTTWSPR